MPDVILNDYLYVLAFLLVAVGFAVGPLVISHFIAPRGWGKARDMTYETGMPPIGSAWIQFGMHYYLYALIFLAFDVEILYLFPVALTYNRGFVFRDLIEVVIFVGILALAIVYAWKEGVFEWGRTSVQPR
ncbi:MAG: NADH-quinone oxidoreductase subunit A [Pseudomonadota bacterium]